MAQFKDLAHLQRYLEKNASKILNDKGIEKVLAQAMSEEVKKVVYENYTPRAYIRREDDGGLSDTRNMHITKVEVKNGKVSILFENLTQGQTRFIPIYEQPLDSLYGHFIADTINDGLRNNWYDPDATDKYGRVVSTPRPFVQETIARIVANPQPLINAIRNAYKKAGFNVK